MIEGWKKWPEEKPKDPNCIKNFCLVKLTNNDYIIASYSIHTDIKGILSISMTAIIGMFGISAALEGYVCRRESIVERILFAAAGFCCVIPGYATDAVGLIVMGLLITYQILRNRAESEKNC